MRKSFPTSAALWKSLRAASCGQLPGGVFRAVLRMESASCETAIPRASAHLLHSKLLPEFNSVPPDSLPSGFRQLPHLAESGKKPASLSIQSSQYRETQETSSGDF